MKLFRVRHLPSLFALMIVGCISISDVSRMMDDARVKTRIGILANTEIGWLNETAKIENAFRFYRAMKVDAVVITGKVTRNDYENQWQVLNEVWQKVFGVASPVRLITKNGEYEINGFRFVLADKRPYSRSEVITFYGDGKRSLTDELSFYPRRNLAISAGSMSGVDVADGSEGRSPLAQAAARAAQGLLVSVYDDGAKIRRLDFVNNEDLADPWEIGSATPEDIVPAAPEFWADASLVVTTGYDKDAKRMWTLLWPNVLKRFTGERARYFEVKARFADGRRLAFETRNVFTRGCYLSEGKDLAGAGCVFSEMELPKADDEHKEFFFEITPIGTFGARGRKLTSENFTLPNSED